MNPLIQKAKKEEREKTLREVYEMGEKQGWDNQVMTDIKHHLMFGIETTKKNEHE